MRHVGSLIAGIVVAPLVWALLALGQGDAGDTTANWVADRGFDTTDLLEPLAYLAVAGIAFGLLATLRLSPVGPLVAGAAFVGPTIALLFAPLAVLDHVSDDYELLDRTFDFRAPLGNGTLLLLGLGLIMAVFSRARWRGEPAVETTSTNGDEVPTTPFPTTNGDPTAPIPSQPTGAPPVDLWSPAPSTYRPSHSDDV